MNRSPLARRSLVKLATLLLVATFTAVPSYADGPKDLEIMVNGPWTFVVYADPSLYNGADRLYLVAPADETHFAGMWSGANASMQNWAQILKQGGLPDNNQILSPSDSNSQYLYSASFSPKPDSLGSISEENESVYQATTRVSQSDIRGLLLNLGTNRYAISLPMPDSVKTYSGDYGPGVAEIKLENKTNPNLTTNARQYSTWTVLHYGVANMAASDSVAMTYSDKFGQHSFSLPIETAKDLDGSIQRYGISIVLMGAPLCKTSTVDHLYYYPKSCTKYSEFSPAQSDDQKCDSLSGFSFANNAALWHMPEHVLFPAEQDWEGTQNPWNYRYDCAPAYKENLQTLHDSQQNAAKRNIKVVSDIKALNEAIGALPQKKAAKAAPRHQERNLAGEQISELSTDFANIANDIALSLPDAIPTEVREAFDCVCAEAAQHSPDTSCPTLKSSGSQSKCPNPMHKDLDTVLQALDKGSSDCHAPQVSIGGAISPQP